VCIRGTAVGTFVTVHSRTRHPQDPVEIAWNCIVSAECEAIRSFPNGSRRTLKVPRGSNVIFLDRHLQPIRPPPIPEQTPAPPIEETADVH